METTTDKDKYNSKILGVRNYESDKENFYSVDFKDIETFVNFIMEVSTGESDLTPAGISYIKSFIDLKDVANQAVYRGLDLPPYDDMQDDGSGSDPSLRFIQYVNDISPMEMALFIASPIKTFDNEARKPSLNDLKEEYLPPQ
jgi:hypothetical protein